MWFRTQKIDQVISLIKKTLENKQQVYWVCPTIGLEVEEDNIEISAKLRFEHLQKIFASDVGFIHGKLKASAKEEMMQNFITGRIRVLVATTVIEVGIDVPNATVLIIEQADKFGLAQLHQLRGRVGRGTAKSICILLFNGNIGVASKRRLQIMKESNDGFYIAEQDFKLRGGGEMLGTKQSGVPEFKTAKLEECYDLLLEASGYAAKFTDSESNLDLLLKLFGYSIDTALVS